MRLSLCFLAVAVEAFSLRGQLVLEQGDATGAYRHATPVVHGLWPDNCVPTATDQTEPQQLASCYTDLTFQQHEWKVHGVCSGASSADSFFAQVCDLSAQPLRLLAESRPLDREGYLVRALDHDQLALRACANDGDHWLLANAQGDDDQRLCAQGHAEL